MKIDLFGLEAGQISAKNNTETSIKMFSKIQVILYLGLTFQLKEMSTSLVLFSSLKEPLMTNLKNSTKKNLKSNYMSEKSW